MIKNNHSQQSLEEAFNWNEASINAEPPVEYNEDEFSGNGSEGSTAGENQSELATPHNCFEGPEKTMEVVFRSDMGPENGLRTLTRKQIDFLCMKAKCTIVNHTSNNFLDAYVLSESSLFIYKHRFIMKTCGTTTLLHCLSYLMEFADELGMDLFWVGYSRKNLMFPSAQLWPHSSFGDEIRYLSTHEQLTTRLRGNGHILGPITGDHWFVYVADHSETSPFYKRIPSMPLPPPSRERTLNMMMFDMDLEVAKTFYKSACETGKEMTIKAGINNLCPGATIDDLAFTPCGYSMNAILHESYYTIHITPEPQCSYCSFETNTILDNYVPLVRNVLMTFKPQRFVLTMSGDELAINDMKQVPTDLSSISLPAFGNYSRTSVSSTNVDLEMKYLMACYTLDTSSTVRLRAATPCENSPTSSGKLNNVLSSENLANLKERSYTWC